MQNKNKAFNLLTPLGLTDFRNTYTHFYIKDADCLRHLYSLTKSGYREKYFAENYGNFRHSERDRRMHA